MKYSKKKIWVTEQNRREVAEHLKALGYHSIFFERDKFDYGLYLYPKDSTAYNASGKDYFDKHEFEELTLNTDYEIF